MLRSLHSTQFSIRAFPTTSLYVLPLFLDPPACFFMTGYRVNTDAQT